MPSPFQTRNIAHNEAKYTTIKLITGNTALTDADTGKVISCDLSAARTVTLPSPKAGLNFKFIVHAVDANPCTSDLVIQAAASSAVAKGGVASLDADGNAIDHVFPDGTDYILTATDAEMGTLIEVFCDGTSWYFAGTVISDDVPAFS